MPGVRCAVAFCNTSRVKAKKSGQHISYFRFPKDQNIRKLWIQKCQSNRDWNNIDNLRVCSNHFKPEDYEDQIRYIHPCIKPIPKLKHTAVPSLNLVDVQNSAFILTSTTNEQSNKELDTSYSGDSSVNKSTVSAYPASPPTAFCQAYNDNDFMQNDFQRLVTLVTGDSSVKNREISAFLAPTAPIAAPRTEPCQVHINDRLVDAFMQKEFQRLIAENVILKIQCLNLKAHNNQINLKVNDLEKDLKQLRDKLTVEKSYPKKTKNLVKKYIYRVQRQIGYKNKMVWKSEEMATASALSQLNKHCYVYIRNTKKLPLPSIALLKR